jgi:predicted amidohydrolase
MPTRRSLLAAALAPSPRFAQPPRKVIVGTAMKPFWVAKHPGLPARLGELEDLIHEMARASHRLHGRSLDLAVLPETCISGEAGGDAASVAVPFDGPVQQTFARLARQHSCYIVVPSYFREGDRCTNSAILVNRQGEQAGTYRKVHLVVGADGKTLEGGSTPGRQHPVFQTDFGRLGIQICYDMEFDSGWRELAAQGAELIAWPTQSPQTSQPAARAAALGCYIVSSTWRNNASIFEPTGKIAAQIRPPAEVLVEELDLTYAILPWSSRLRNGKAFEQAYGAKAGFRYYEDEDRGIFWSNDPKTPIGQMIQSLGLREWSDTMTQVKETYRRAGVPV